MLIGWQLSRKRGSPQVDNDDNLRSVSGYNLGGSYISSSGSSYSFTSGNYFHPQLLFNSIITILINFSSILIMIHLTTRSVSSVFWVVLLKKILDCQRLLLFLTVKLPGGESSLLFSIFAILDSQRSGEVVKWADLDLALHNNPKLFSGECNKFKLDFKEVFTKNKRTEKVQISCFLITHSLLVQIQLWYDTGRISFFIR